MSECIQDSETGQLFSFAFQKYSKPRSFHLLVAITVMMPVPQRLLLATFASFGVLFGRLLALDNGVGLTPPLAYSTWNYFNNDVNETLVRQLADGLVRSRLVESGYDYINIDAGYLVKERDASVSLVSGWVLRLGA